MATLVFFHAHPDDEAITTGGTMARAAAEGHRVVLVVATGGEYGEKPEDLGSDETLADRRRAETRRSAAALGVHRVAWLGYLDSGMTGWEQNGATDSFWSAPVDEAGARLAQLLRDENAEVLTCYDWHGNYGHPDHVQVHRVGHRAAELAATPRVYEATTNRDSIRSFMSMAKEMGASADDTFDPDAPADDGNPFGVPEAELTTAVDVTAFTGQKRASIACHASQVSDSSFFLQMPAEQFAMAFGTEWYIRVGAPAGVHESWLLD
jgi:LmbE family N-acetylglucosaminyl deacetylase